MKVEQRTVYIADDGSEFDSEVACETYEDQEQLMEKLYNACSLGRADISEVVGVLLTFYTVTRKF